MQAKMLTLYQCSNCSVLHSREVEAAICCLKECCACGTLSYPQHSKCRQCSCEALRQARVI